MMFMRTLHIIFSISVILTAGVIIALFQLLFLEEKYIDYIHRIA